MAEDLEPGCVLLDLCMPDVSGIDTLVALQDRTDTFPVIIITGMHDVAAVVTAMKLGAVDVLVKPLQTDALVAALQEGEAALKRETRRHNIAKQAEMKLQRLTRREREVLSGLAKGFTNKAIGENLGISSRTVEIHRAHLIEKLDVHSFSELLRIVYESELDLNELGDVQCASRG